MFKLIFRLVLLGSLLYFGRKALQRWMDGPEMPSTAGTDRGGSDGFAPSVVPGPDAGSGAVEVDTAAGGPVGPSVAAAAKEAEAARKAPAKKAPAKKAAGAGGSAGAAKAAGPVGAAGAVRKAATPRKAADAGGDSAAPAKAAGVRKSAPKRPPVEGG